MQPLSINAIQNTVQQYRQYLQNPTPGAPDCEQYITATINDLTQQVLALELQRSKIIPSAGIGALGTTWICSGAVQVGGILF
jgi:hypothetical protein